MGSWTILLVLLCAWLLAGQDKKLGSVEFFPYDAVNIAALREALPVRVGQPFSLAMVEETKSSIRAAVQKQLGRRPSDVAAVCCDDQGDWILFVGLRREASGYRPERGGSVRLPGELVRLEKSLMASWMQAVQKGAGSEDRSKGHALSSDPALRAQQRKLRSLALRLEAKLFDVLGHSSDAEHRAIAANRSAMRGKARAS